MHLRELLDGMEVVEIRGDANVEISHIAYDSRKVYSGAVFVCIDGYKADGHRYAGIAVENGAVVLVVQKDIEISGDVTVVRVHNTRIALAQMAAAYYGWPSRSFTLDGVTGTNGKTTTTYLYKAIMEKAGYKVGLIGTIANIIGNDTVAAERTTPESLDLQKLFRDMVDHGVNKVIMEVSSHSLDLNRVDICEFDTGIFTNLTQDHLDFHVTMDNYLKAKQKLFKKCKNGLINNDDPNAASIIASSPAKSYTYAVDNDADIRALDVREYPDCVTFTLKSPWCEMPVKVGMPGKINVYNALAAAGAALIEGIAPEMVCAGLEKVRVPGRSEVVDTRGGFTLIIDYAHTPDGLENILKVVRGYAPGRVVCLFGCGGDRDRSKRSVMGSIAGRFADFSIVTSDNPRTEDPEGIINDIEEGLKMVTGDYVRIADRRSAIEYAIFNAKKDDIIVLAGKGHETYQIFKNKTIHFDEREVVAEIMEKFLASTSN